MITKVLKFWPVIVAMAGMIVGYTTLNNTVNWNVRKIRSHEKRIAKVEYNAAITRVNTDALVETLLSERQKSTIKHQVDGLSAYILKDDTKEEEQ